MTQASAPSSVCSRPPLGAPAGHSPAVPGPGLRHTCPSKQRSSAISDLKCPLEPHVQKQSAWRTWPRLPQPRASHTVFRRVSFPNRTGNKPPNGGPVSPTTSALCPQALPWGGAGTTDPAALACPHQSHTRRPSQVKPTTPLSSGEDGWPSPQARLVRVPRSQYRHLDVETS